MKPSSCNAFLAGDDPQRRTRLPLRRSRSDKIRLGIHGTRSVSIADNVRVVVVRTAVHTCALTVVDATVTLRAVCTANGVAAVAVYNVTGAGIVAIIVDVASGGRSVGNARAHDKEGRCDTRRCENFVK